MTPAAAAAARRRDEREREIVAFLLGRGGRRRGSMRSLAELLAGAEGFRQAIRRLRERGVIRVGTDWGDRFVELVDAELGR